MNDFLFWLALSPSQLFILALVLLLTFFLFMFRFAPIIERLVLLDRLHYVRTAAEGFNNNNGQLEETGAPCGINGAPWPPCGINEDLLPPCGIYGDALSPCGIDGDALPPCGIDGGPLPPSGIDGNPLAGSPSNYAISTNIDLPRSRVNSSQRVCSCCVSEDGFLARPNLARPVQSVTTGKGATMTCSPPRDTSPHQDSAGTAGLTLARPNLARPVQSVTTGKGVTRICSPPRDTSPHQDSAGTAPSGTSPSVQPPPPPQTMTRLPPRDTSPYQDIAGTAPSGSPPSVQPPSPPQTMTCSPPRDTSPHQDSAGTAPSGPPPAAQPRLPPQTRGIPPHSAPTPLKRPMLTPEGGPRPRVSASIGTAIQSDDALVASLAARELASPLNPLSSLAIDPPCECEHNDPDSPVARQFSSVVLAVAPAVTMDEASSLSWLAHPWSQGRCVHIHTGNLSFAGERAAADCSPAACSLHRAEERESNRPMPGVGGRRGTVAALLPLFDPVISPRNTALLARLC